MRKPIVGVICNVKRINFENREFVDINYATEKYIESLEKADCVPLLIPCMNDQTSYQALLDVVDGLLLTGGADIDPMIFGQDQKPGIGEVYHEVDVEQIYLAQYAKEHNIPILGICKGAQVMNVALGGTLIQDIERELPQATLHSQTIHSQKPSHRIRLGNGSKLQEIFGTELLDTNSFHHQSIDQLGEGLCVTAQSNDGIVEAVEHMDHPFYVGVQWHPEMMLWDGSMEPLFDAFHDAMV